MKKKVPTRRARSAGAAADGGVAVAAEKEKPGTAGAPPAAGTPQRRASADIFGSFSSKRSIPPGSPEVHELASIRGKNLPRGKVSNASSETPSRGPEQRAIERQVVEAVREFLETDKHDTGDLTYIKREMGGERRNPKIVSTVVKGSKTWDDLGLTPVQRMKLLLHVEREFGGLLQFPDEVADRITGIQEVVEYIIGERARGIPIPVKPLMCSSKFISKATMGRVEEQHGIHGRDWNDWHTRWRV